MAEGELVFGDENEIAKVIRTALGVGDFEPVRVMTSQIERSDGKVITYFPKTVEEFDNLKKAPHDVLIDIGVSLFESGHYLYPGEWYDFIPEGYEVITIFNETELFERSKSDDDTRYGCLSYGFKRELFPGDPIPAQTE